MPRLTLLDGSKESRRAEKPAQGDQKRRGVGQAGFLRRRPINEKAHRNENGTERLHNLPAERNPSVCLVRFFWLFFRHTFSARRAT